MWLWKSESKKQLEGTDFASVKEMLLHLLETRKEQDRWLLVSLETVRAKIRRGMDQLDRDEGIPEERLGAYGAEQKAKT